jgi:hypothetical protein
MRKPEYKKGAEARKNFEEIMKKLFRFPKPAKPEKRSPENPTCRKTTGSDKG